MIARPISSLAEPRSAWSAAKLPLGRPMRACCGRTERSSSSRHLAASHDCDEESRAAGLPGSRQDGCVFCQIATGHLDRDKVVHETDRLAVFWDRSPAAQAHLQIVPKWHVDNLNDLCQSAEDHALVAEMLSTGQEVLQRMHPGAVHRFGFHKPPFNSVLHLHMHALALPYLPGAPKWKYSEWTPWWLPAEDALQRLEPPQDHRA